MTKIVPINTPNYQKVITELEGKEVTIVKKSPIHGGCINNCYCLSLSNGNHFFLKENSHNIPSFFAIESNSLIKLKEINQIKVPTPIAYCDIDHSQFLLLEWIEIGNYSKHFWKQLGEELAKLHQIPQSNFGLDFDNFIGMTPQKNKKEQNWIDFFRERRLNDQMQLAKKNGKWDTELFRKTEKLMSSLNQYLIEPQFPSFLHGDLWSGNVLSNKNDIPFMVDPAIYCGHFEADLAMTELFGGFDNVFYQAYKSVNPIDSEYKNRRDIYNIYHLYNHLNLFGSAYYSRLFCILKHYTG